MKRSIFFVFCSLLSANYVHAQSSVCDAILKHGIFDRSNTSDLKTRYELVKNAHCESEAKDRSSAGGLGYGELFVEVSDARSESRKFCASSYQEVQENAIFLEAISKASPVIANSWTDCIRLNAAGVSHYIQPTSDPSKFTYKIQYTADGQPHATELVNWTISGVNSCQPAVPKQGQRIDSSRYEIQCSRKPSNMVLITANAISGGRNLRRVELPAYTPPRPDYCRQILTGVGQNQPHVSAAVPGGGWKYTVPYNITHSDSRKVSGQYTVHGTVNVKLTHSYLGSPGDNIVTIKGEYTLPQGGYRAYEGRGVCRQNEILSKYTYTQGPPSGQKGIERIAPLP